MYVPIGYDIDLVPNLERHCDIVRTIDIDIYSTYNVTVPLEIGNQIDIISYRYVHFHHC